MLKKKLLFVNAKCRTSKSDHLVSLLSVYNGTF